MKVTLVVLACMALAGLTAAYVHVNAKPVDKVFLEKQKFLLEIVYRVEDPLQFEEWIKYGKKLIVDKTKYETYDDVMDNFYDAYQMGAILPQGEFFSVIQKQHNYQALGLFGYFFYAKDWETFVSNVAWARMHVNEGMFVYALTLAVIHRPDMKNLILPPIYEIIPQMFLYSEYILHAEKFNADVWNRQIMLEKELMPVYRNKYASKIFKERFHLKDWKVWQWWKLMGLDEGWHLEEKTILRNNIEALQNDPKFKAVWTDVNAYWLPVDYTRNIEIFNKESILSYFTEDVGLNAYWYYLNMYYANVLGGPQFHFDVNRRGELWIFNAQQLLARYYAERLSVGLGAIDEFSFYGIIKHGYDPQLIAYNGNGYTYRKNYYEIYSHQNIEILNRIVAISRRIQDVIDSGKYVTRDGKVIDLTLPESSVIVANLLQGNADAIDKQFFGYLYPMFGVLYSNGDVDSYTVQPNVLSNPETMLRDPIFYIFLKKFVYYYQTFQSHLPVYPEEQIKMTSLKVYDAEVSSFTTYFDLVDIDTSTLLNDKMVFHEGNYVWDKTLLARQLRLNHKPFNFQIKVKSDLAQKVVVRVFLTPVFDEYDQHIDLFTHTENFMLLDKFVYDLTPGENVVTRNSQDFTYTVKDFTTYTELYKYVMLAYEGKQEFPMDVAQRHCGYPDRLVLPRGWVEGMPMKLIFFFSPYTGKPIDTETQQIFTCNIGTEYRYIDNLPFFYPFDRKIENIYEFFGPNLLVKDVKIYHTEKYEKYYPNKYPNFGTFDYAY